MTRSLPRFGRLALALAAMGMLAPSSGLAQIASPSNAGGNAGNNSSGASASPISTPSFAPSGPVSAVSGVSVTNASSITASPQQTSAMQTGATQAAAQQSAALQQMVAEGGSAPQVVVGPAAQVPNITIDLGGGPSTTSIADLPAALGGIGSQASLPSGGATRFSNLIAGLPAALSGIGIQAPPPLRSRSMGFSTLIADLPGARSGSAAQKSLTLTSAATGVTTTIASSGPGGVVTLSLSSGESLQIATTPQTTVGVMQFAAMASVVGLSLNSIQVGLQVLPLVMQASGSSVQGALQVMQLLAGIQGLASQSNLANLSQAITTFNTVVTSAPPEVLAALAGNATFSGIGAVIRAAHAGVAGGA